MFTPGGNDVAEQCIKPLRHVVGILIVNGE